MEHVWLMTYEHYLRQGEKLDDAVANANKAAEAFRAFALKINSDKGDE